MSPGTIWDSKRHFTFQLESIVDLTVASQTDNGISAAACGLVPCHVVQPKCGPFACGRQASRASATARTGCHAQVVGPAHACGGFNAFLPQTHFDVRCQVDHVLPAPPRLRRGRATASQTPEVHVRRHGSGGQRAHTRESARARAQRREREKKDGGALWGCLTHKRGNRQQKQKQKQRVAKTSRARRATLHVRVTARVVTPFPPSAIG